MKQCPHCRSLLEVCPRCGRELARDQIHRTMVGSFPIACTICTPEPPRQEYRLADTPGVGPYRPGSVLFVDGEPFMELT